MKVRELIRDLLRVNPETQVVVADASQPIGTFLEIISSVRPADRDALVIVARPKSWTEMPPEPEPAKPPEPYPGYDIIDTSEPLKGVVQSFDESKVIYWYGGSLVDRSLLRLPNISEVHSPKKDHRPAPSEDEIARTANEKASFKMDVCTFKQFEG